MNLKTTRYKQRFENLDKAFLNLKEAVENYDKLSNLELEGLVQRFEYSFELSWKILKDYLETQGENIKSPRDSIKIAFSYEIIDNGDVWMDMLEKRNLFSHTYDENLFNKSIDYIVNDYFIEIEKLHIFFENKCME
jgi:nucleotidyltransferase substrate binding protein (TIGR01987 family)